MRQLPWILLAAALLIILFLMNRKPAHSDMVPRAQFTAMEQRLNDTANAYHSFKQQSDSAIDNVTVMAIQANERADKYEASLNESKGTIKWLLNQLDIADKEKPDSSWVQVSPRFKDGCDSLRKENIKLGDRITQYEQGNQQQEEILNYEVHLRDSLLERERQFNDQFKKSLQDCIAIGKQAQKAGQPRNQIYAGFGVIGSQINPFAGGEINLSLKTKRDQIYEVKGALILSTWYVGAGTKFKLHF